MTREEQRARKAQQERMRQVERRHKEAARGQMDLPFLILTLLLTVIGLIMLFSASFPRAYYDTGDGTYYFKRQAAFAALGLVAMFIVSKINYQRWRGAGRLLVGLALFLLILVIIPHNPLAITSNNATRWLGIRGVFQFQPSEIAKLAVIVYFSDTISKKREKMLTWRQGILPYVALLAVIGVLMMLEPHLSGHRSDLRHRRGADDRGRHTGLAGGGGRRRHQRAGLPVREAGGGRRHQVRRGPYRDVA